MFNFQLSTKCLIALGSNLGDRLSHLKFAINAINATRHTKIFRISALYKTSPVGGPENQNPYYNAALLALSTLSAKDLLLFLNGIENQRQRIKLVHWGPRTLDLDLLIYGTNVRDDGCLILPHPRMHERRFVMVPVCDVAPQLLHPKLNLTMCQLLSKLSVDYDELVLLHKEWWTCAI
ncbi:MAG: hypothetical protein TECD_01150 [Hyphomicrobiaceae bacterium hypho_1]